MGLPTRIASRLPGANGRCVNEPGDALVGRRSFLQRLGGSLAAFAALPMPGPWLPHPEQRSARSGHTRRLDRIGIQLYTVRTLMKRDAEHTLATLAEIGYQEVELAGLYGMSAREMRTLLDRYNLSAPSGHTGTAELRGDWQRTLGDATTLGQRYITCAWIDESERTVDGYRRVAELFNRSAETARRAGLQFCYHNHDFEFAKLDGVVPYDLLLSACDPELVKMEMDIFWLVKGGRQPLDYFAEYPGRFPLVHVKDMDSAGRMVDVGKGVIDFRAIFERSSQAGIRHYFVEHDNPRPPMESARASYDYLRHLQF